MLGVVCEEAKLRLFGFAGVQYGRVPRGQPAGGRLCVQIAYVEQA